jgi:DegV family protein with EDD domain
MRVQLVVDSGCDLPDHLFNQFKLPVLPHVINVAGSKINDQRNAAQMSHFYNMSMASTGKDVQTEAMSLEVIEQKIQGLLDANCKDIVIQTISKDTSLVFEQIEKAIPKIQKKNAAKQAHIHLVDSKSMFTGQGLLASYSLELIKKGLSGEQVKQKAEQFSQSIYAYATIPNVSHLRERSGSKDRKGLTVLKSALAKVLGINPVIQIHNSETGVVSSQRGHEAAIKNMLEIAIEAIEQQKLLYPMVNISVGSKVEEIPHKEYFTRLENLAKQHNISVEYSMMSLSGGVNLGPNSITMALALKES